MTARYPHHEIWHDYFSVPQWQQELKGRILLTNPLIFQRAECTIVFIERHKDRDGHCSLPWGGQPISALLR